MKRTFVKGGLLAFFTAMLLFVSCQGKKATDSASGSVKLGVVYGAAHGVNCFSVAAAVVDASDGTILDAFLDEYQYLDTRVMGVDGVPNSASNFGLGNIETVVLGSKKHNTDYYSSLMTEHAGATVTIDANYAALEAYAAGKKSGALADVDAVSGATLADTANYLKLIAEAADVAMASENSYVVSNVADVKLTSADYSAHGNQCFAFIVDAVEGDKIVATYIDEFQYFDIAVDGIIGVPNSDAGFGQNYAMGKILGSKKQNSEYYSSLMKDHAGSTVSLDANYAALEAYAVGKTVAELDKGVDTVSGATLADTPNYLKGVAYAAIHSK